MPQIAVHGGDVYSHRIRQDFSVNINPLDIGEEIRSRIRETVSHYDRYPQVGNWRLRETIGNSVGLDARQVLCGNGASELLAAVMHAFRPAAVMTPQPAFAGYAWAAQMVGARQVNYLLREADGFAITEEILEKLTEDLGMLILTNPSNPTGRLLEPELLYKILERCREKNILVLVDECFIEFTGQESACTLLASFENLLVLRAFTKIYGVPGIRLGYLLATGTYCEKIERQLPEWNLSVMAQETGLAIMESPRGGWNRKAFIQKTVCTVKEESGFLKEELINISHGGIKVYPSEANFLLLKTAVPLYDRLLEQGILIRDCSNYVGLSREYYRIAVRLRKENQLLLEALSQVYGSGNQEKDR